MKWSSAGVFVLVTAGASLAGCARDGREHEAPRADGGATRAPTTAASTSPVLAAASASAPAFAAPAPRAALDGGAAPEDDLLATRLVDVRPGGPRFRFELRGGGDAVATIAVRDAASGALVQTLSPRDAFGEPCTTELEPPDEAWGFLAVDMNFDGLRDVRLQCGEPAPVLVAYRNWLFDRKLGHFVASAELDAIASAEYDAARRVILSIGEITCKGPHEVVYRWVGGHPIPVSGDDDTPCE